MLESMTGFGKAEKQSLNKKIIIEIKTLNSKQLDLILRMPALYREREWEFRKKIAETLMRGKVECCISLEGLAADKSFRINKEVVHTYMDELKTVSPGFREIDYLSLAVRMPEVLNASHTEIEGYEWQEVHCLIDKALAAVKKFRADEGKILQRELIYRIENILKWFDQLGPFEMMRKNSIRQKLQKAFDQSALQLDPNRLEQELIYYLEKWDITEEMLRLKNHCDYFSETMQQFESPGKKLGFIIQEIGRELNTLGAKAQNVEIQKIVVQMKDELEKIKEQLLNVL
ncbi:MAG: DUF1732 domain-containing protein [Flavobacteriales bacterium]